MKKIMALACALIFALSLTACGNKTDMGSDIKDGVSKAESALESGVSDIASGANDIANGNNQSSMTAKITADEAKDKVFKHAGVSEGDVTGLDVDLDRDNSVLKYEIDFHHGGIEYDYDVNAETGEIISVDKDKD